MIFFALSYLIAWSTLPFGSFPRLFATRVGDRRRLHCRGLAGLARLGRRLIRWRVNWIWYAAAIGLPLLVHGVAIGLKWRHGAPAPSLTQFQPWYAVLLAFGLGMVNPLEGPLGEEPGWRGFAQPRLQSKWSPLASTALLGLLITGWHLPLVFMPQFDLGLPDIATTVGHLLVRLVVQPDRRQRAADADRSRDRGLINIQSLWPAGADADREVWTYLVAWTLLAVALLIFDRKSWRTAPESAIDRVPGRIS